MSLRDEAAAAVRAHVRVIPDWPVPGVLFQDLGPVLADSRALSAVVAGLADDAVTTDVDLVVGVEARGLPLAAALAARLGVGYLPVRKEGKLPPPTTSRACQLEYGAAVLEISPQALDGRRVLLVDDVLATGGTLDAAAGLLAEAGATVAGVSVVLAIDALGGAARLRPLEVRALHVS